MNWITPGDWTSNVPAAVQPFTVIPCEVMDAFCDCVVVGSLEGEPVESPAQPAVIAGATMPRATVPSALALTILHFIIMPPCSRAWAARSKMAPLGAAT
jgi:hypothetical protein